MNVFKNILDKQLMESAIRSPFTESIFSIYSVMLLDPYLVSERGSGVYYLCVTLIVLYWLVCIYVCVTA